MGLGAKSFMTFHPIPSEFPCTVYEENLISFMSVCNMYVFKHQVTLRKLKKLFCRYSRDV